MDAAAASMSRMTLDSKPTLLDKRAPGGAGRPMEVSTNITPLTIKADQDYYKYDVRMYAIFDKRDGTEGVREFSKQTKDDFSEQERKCACTEIFVALANSHPDFIYGDLIYDRAAILFATQPLAKITQTEHKFTLPTNCQTICEDAKRVEVDIKQAATGFKVSTADLVSCVNADFKGTSKELLEVLNLATSQIPFFEPQNYITFGTGNIYLMNPGAFGFAPTDAPAIGQDKFVGIGLSKSVKILEGPGFHPSKKDYMTGLVLDVKKTAFHNERQSLDEKILKMYGNSKPSQATLVRDLKDIRCLMKHKKGQVVIGGFTVGPVSNATFKDNNKKQLSVVEYYESKYKIKLMRPDLPGIVCKHSKGVFPAELLEVAPSQRVKGSQATKETVEALIKVAAIKPEVRYRQTQALAKLLKLDSERAMGMGVMVPTDQESLTAPARQLPSVGLLGGQGTMTGPAWRGNAKFVVGAKLEKWATFCFFNSNAKTRYNPNQTHEGFVGKLREAGNRKGMKIDVPCVVDSCDTKGGYVDPYIETAVKRAVDAGCSYVLIVSDDKIKSHEQLKHSELTCKIVTQEVTLSKAAQVAYEGKQQTLENILMKMNAKLRGMNHVVAADGGMHQHTDAIIMGIFVQQPRSMTDAEMKSGSRPTFPAVIGLSANNGDLQEAPPQQRDAASQQYFTTAWKYANPKEWTVGEQQRETLQNMIVAALVQFKNNRGKAPMKVVVYRGGISEGQLPYVASVERDVFQAAFKQLSAEYNPVLVMIACSKEHNERFYHKVMPTAAPGSRVDTNLPPGVIIDRVVVNPEMNEFYLQSHKALQGTARATKYTLVHDSTGVIKNDQIQHMTMALCHLHQIVNSTTAIPTPLYVAEESAKRAINIFHHAKGGCEVYELDEINAELSPEGLGARINA